MDTSTPPQNQSSGKRSGGDIDPPISKSLKVQGPVPRFLVLHATGEKSLAALSPFAIQKGLEGMAGKTKSVKKLRSGDLLVETATDKQTELLLRTKSLADTPISVSPHNTLNSCRGVIICDDVKNMAEEELQQELASQGVIGVRRIYLKKDGLKVPSRVHIITFNSPRMPTNIQAGYLNLPVREFVPNPLRCFKCQRFGHGKFSCRGSDTCARCGTPGHDSEACQKEPKCVNCSESHPSYSRSCQKWKEEKEIQSVKTSQKISYPEARRLVTAAFGGKSSYASVVKSTSDKGCQTDFPPPLASNSIGSPDRTKSSSSQPVAPKCTTTVRVNKPKEPKKGPSVLSSRLQKKKTIFSRSGTSATILHSLPDRVSTSYSSGSEDMDCETAGTLACMKGNRSPPGPKNRIKR